MRPTITNQAYISTRPIRKTYSTDAYYVPLANKILRCLVNNYKGKQILTVDTLTAIAYKVTWYFEDIVSDMGIWRSFSEQCKELYGYNVPIYHFNEEYYADEPSLNAIRYIVWDVVSELHYNVSVFPESGKLPAIANDIFNILDKEFENAPVNDDEKTDIKTMIQMSCKSFDNLRNTLDWVLTGNYMSSNLRYFADVNDAANQLGGLEYFNGIDNSMKLYYIKTNFTFRYKTGPLARLSFQWLADLARIYGLEKEQKLLEGIEVLGDDTYRYKVKDETWLHMESIHGKKFDIRTKELNLPEKALETNNGCMGQFVFFDGEWHLNGILSSHDLKDSFEKLKKETETEETKVDTKKLLEATGGKRILYYKDVSEMIADLQEKKIIAEGQTPPFADDPNCKMPLFFIDEASMQDNNMFFGFNIEQDIKDPSNPYYDKNDAEKNAVNLLWEDALPATLVDYLIDNDLLPDAADSKMFIQGSTPDDIRSDMHFMVRYTRRSNYM